MKKVPKRTLMHGWTLDKVFPVIGTIYFFFDILPMSLYVDVESENNIYYFWRNG